MKVQRILHLRVRQPFHQEPLMTGGATVILDGDTNTTQVQVRVAFCNSKDVFCKKTGRLTAEASNIDVIPLRSLPGELGKLHKEVYRRNHVKLDHSRAVSYAHPNFDHKIREFLPKE